MADKTNESSTKSGSRRSASSLRTRLAHIIWLVCVVCALLLAIGALLVALKANESNDLVAFVKDAASAVDLGVFDRKDGIFKFDGDNATTKNALVNWGLGAVVWLVVGRVLDRLVRP